MGKKGKVFYRVVQMVCYKVYIGYIAGMVSSSIEHPTGYSIRYIWVVF